MCGLCRRQSFTVGMAFSIPKVIWIQIILFDARDFKILQITNQIVQMNSLRVWIWYAQWLILVRIKTCWLPEAVNVAFPPKDDINQWLSAKGDEKWYHIKSNLSTWKNPRSASWVILIYGNKQERYCHKPFTEQTMRRGRAKLFITYRILFMIRRGWPFFAI